MWSNSGRTPSYQQVIDFHLHILPGVDDGAASMEEAVEMARQLALQRVSVAVATPHYSHSAAAADRRGLIRDQYARLTARLAEEGIPLELRLGCEVKASEELLYCDDPDELAVEGTRCVLLEAPFFDAAPWLGELVYALGVWRLCPILAHPERCLCLAKDLNGLGRLIDQGARLQLNAGSFLGDYGHHAQRAALQMLRRGWAHVIGSDAHGPPQCEALSAGLMKMSQAARLGDPEDLFFHNAKRILDGKANGGNVPGNLRQ